MPGNELYAAMETRRGVVDQTRENTARIARAYGTHVTTGWGETLVTDPILFGCTFVNPPAVTTGFVVESSTAAGADEPLILQRYPRAMAGVWKWVQNVNDHYTGAYVFMVVETMGFQQYNGIPVNNSDPGYKITHHLIFEGVSYKDFNPAKVDY